MRVEKFVITFLAGALAGITLISSCTLDYQTTLMFGGAAVILTLFYFYVEIREMKMGQ